MNYPFFQSDFLSRRALAFSGIAACHILIAYLLLTALVQPASRAADPPPLKVVLTKPDPEPVRTIDDIRPHAPSPRLPDLPRDPVVSPPDAAPLAPEAVVDPAAGSGAAIPPAAPIRTLGSNQLPNSEDYYPPDLRRLAVQGATNVRVCVDAQGTRVGDPVVEESSGNARLDLGAVNIARHGRYARAVQGDTPVGSCYRFRISFKIAH